MVAHSLVLSPQNLPPARLAATSGPLAPSLSEIALLMLLSAWVKRCPNRLLRRAFGSKRGVSPRPPLSRSAPYDCYIYSNYLFRLAKCVRQRCKLRSSGLEPSGVTTAGNF